MTFVAFHWHPAMLEMRTRKLRIYLCHFNINSSIEFLIRKEGAEEVKTLIYALDLYSHTSTPHVNIPLNISVRRKWVGKRERRGREHIINRTMNWIGAYSCGLWRDESPVYALIAPTVTTLKKGTNGAIERNRTKNKLKLWRTANGAPHFIRARNYFDVTRANALSNMGKCSAT